MMLPPPARCSAGYAVFAAEKDAFDVDRHRQVPDGFAGIDGVIVGGVADAGVIEKDIQLAVGRFGGSDHVLAVGCMGDIGAHISSLNRPAR